MTKLCIVDIDGVVADASARFERAELERSLYLAGTDQPERLQREATDVYWRAALNPDLVELDTLLPEADTYLHRLEEQGYNFLFLTSRPESMRDATMQWFWKQGDLYGLIDANLVMKAPAFQYTKTVTWKAGMVETLMRLTEANETIYIDDELPHHAEVQRFAPFVKCYASLAAVFEPEKPIEGVEDPFLPDFPDE